MFIHIKHTDIQNVFFYSALRELFNFAVCGLLLPLFTRWCLLVCLSTIATCCHGESLGLHWFKSGSRKMVTLTRANWRSTYRSIIPTVHQVINGKNKCATYYLILLVIIYINVCVLMVRDEPKTTLPGALIYKISRFINNKDHLRPYGSQYDVPNWKNLIFYKCFCILSHRNQIYVLISMKTHLTWSTF